MLAGMGSFVYLFFILLILSVLGVRWCVGFSLVLASRGISSLLCADLLWRLLLLPKQALGVWASIVVENGVSCPLAWGILPDQRLNLNPLHLAGGFLTTEPPGKPQDT